MRKLLIILFLIGLETRALAHEDRITVFDYPAHLVLTNLLYALTGISLVFASRAFAPDLHIAARLAIASILSLFIWYTAFFLFLDPNASFFEGLGNLVWAAFSTDISATFVPGIVVICGVGIFDQRKRSEQTETGRYAALR